MYALEKHLVEDFAALSSDFLTNICQSHNKRTWQIFEFDSRFGVADIVFGIFNKHLEERQKRPYSINPNWIFPLTRMNEGAEFSIDAFSEMFCVSKNISRKSLQEYENAGFLMKVESYYKLILQYKPATDFVISIEAKLRDWKKALNQARRYKKFSDLSFVLMDANQANSAIANIDLFREAGIGLICIRNGKLDFHFVPEQNLKKNREFEYRVSETLLKSYFLSLTAS